MKSPLKVLLLEDSEDDALLLIRELHRGGFETSFERVWSESQMKDALRNRWDIIISAVVMPGFNGLTALSSLKESGFDIPFIMVSGTLGEEFAVEAMRRGASDYLLKGRLSRLGTAVARALKEKEAGDEQKRAEETRRKTEERFAAFMAHLPAFAWIKDDTGRYVYVNRTYSEQLIAGTDPIGKTDKQLWPADTATPFLENDQVVWNSPTVLETIERFTFADRPRQALVRKFPIKDKSGTTILTGGVGIDITELLETEQRFRQLTENIQKVFWVTDPRNTEMLYVSPAYEKIWGRSCRSLYEAPQSWADAIHPDDRERVQQAEGNRRALGSHDHTYRIIRPDGVVRWIRDRAFPVKNEQGALYRVAGIAEDVTQSVEAEEKLRAAGERLQTLSRRLLEVQDVERRHIARELHDQIGQMLTASKINLQELRHLREPSTIHERLNDSISIIDQLLGRVRKLSLDLHPPLLDDLGLAATLEWFLQHQEERCGFHTELIVTEPDQRYHLAIETACFRVVQEAVTNIVRHARATRIRVELGCAGTTIEVSITDDGAGFDYEQAKQNAARGDSLGLLGMEERVLLVGGRFTCESQPGRGTRIRALLPMQPHKPSVSPDAG